MYYTINYNSPLGSILIASTKTHIVGLWLDSQINFAKTFLNDNVEQNQNLPILKRAKTWLDNYFAGNKISIKDLEIEFTGTFFQKLVWQILCEIPYGQTLTYGNIAKQIAEKLGKKSMSAQAVGGAVGQNHISIIVPCHRVVGTGEKLTGYSGGLDKKIALLKIENVDITILK